jgi:hypothetical protein
MSLTYSNARTMAKVATTIEFPPTQSLRYLRPEEYPLWEDLVEVSPQGNVFCRPWYLEALQADVRVLAYVVGDRLIAGIPLYFQHRFGLTLCRMPQLVHTWGVIMEPLEGKHATVHSREMKILTLFARQLSKEKFFLQSFHPTLLNWLPFYWNGFKQTTHFTYVLEDFPDLDKIWDQMGANVRRNIHKAERAGIKIVPCNSDLVAATAEKTFKHQYRKLPYSRSYIKQLYLAAKHNSAGECFAAIDKQGKTHAATFVVWDHKRAYYLASGTDPELRTSGAQSLLIWHLLEFTAGLARTFDFVGSVVEPIGRFFGKFGAKLVPHNRIMRLPWPVQAYLSVRPVQ